VVEDDPPTREALGEMLRQAGAEVRDADSASAALRVLDEFQPDVLVSDIAMPEEDGISLLARIRARGPGRGADLPAVALTALAGPDDRRRTLAAGFQAHLAKPIDVDRLVGTIASLLPRRRRKS
jgi:CheY-like chemotaxis protein